MKSDEPTRLPSFREQYAVVYDEYLDTLGGGERSALAFALALKQLDFKVEVVSTRPIPSQQKICDVFGQEFENIPLKQIKTDNISKFLLHAEIRVFVNHTYMSFHRNPAKLGIYAQMFPGHLMSRHSHPEFYQALQSYKLMLCNSSFTKKYTDGMWDYPSTQSHVLNPPIGDNHIKAAQLALMNPPRKTKKIVHVGRFNPGNHNKNQLLLIKAFRDAKASDPSLKDWQFVLIGNVNSTPESLEYYQACKELAATVDGVRILTDLPHAVLEKEIEDSFCYLHGTGAFLPPGTEPHKCEHYGLSIVESMAHGCIPLVYARGGVFDVMEVDRAGLIYISYESLVSSITEVTKLWNTDKGAQMRSSAIESASQQGQREFTAKLGQFIASTL